MKNGWSNSRKVEKGPLREGGEIPKGSLGGSREDVGWTSAGQKDGETAELPISAGEKVSGRVSTRGRIKGAGLSWQKGGVGTVGKGPKVKNSGRRDHTTRGLKSVGPDCSCVRGLKLLRGDGSNGGGEDRY